MSGKRAGQRPNLFPVRQFLSVTRRGFEVGAEPLSKKSLCPVQAHFHAFDSETKTRRRSTGIDFTTLPKQEYGSVVWRQTLHRRQDEFQQLCSNSCLLGVAVPGREREVIETDRGYTPPQPGQGFPGRDLHHP